MGESASFDVDSADNARIGLRRSDSFTTSEENQLVGALKSRSNLLRKTLVTNSNVGELEVFAGSVLDEAEDADTDSVKKPYVTVQGRFRGKDVAIKRVAKAGLSAAELEATTRDV